MNKKIDITLHKGFYPISEVRDFIEVVCRAWGFSSRYAHHIKTAADEALTNIVRHAYKNNPGKIKLQMNYHRNTMKMTIKDWGKPLTSGRTRVPADLVKKKKDRGLGLVMINRLMNEVRRVRRKTYNELIMIKHQNERHERH